MNFLTSDVGGTGTSAGWVPVLGGAQVKTATQSGVDSYWRHLKRVLNVSQEAINWKQGDIRLMHKSLCACSRLLFLWLCLALPAHAVVNLSATRAVFDKGAVTNPLRLRTVPIIR